MKTVRVLTVLFVLIANCCLGQAPFQPPPDVPEWKEVNDQLIKKYNIAIRKRDDVPDTKVISNVDYGKVVNLLTLPALNLAPGISAKAYWGMGNLMSFIDLEPNAAMPAETLEGERFLIVLKGDVEEIVNGTYRNMKAINGDAPDGTHSTSPRSDFVYFQKGSVTSIRAGKEGAKVLEVYYPVPPKYLKLSGAFNIPEPSIQTFPLKPSVQPDSIYNLYDIQYTELVPGSNSRIISGNGIMMSFIRMDPNAKFAYHIHPEEQVMIVLRGWIDEFVLDRTIRMKDGDIVRLPPNYAHGGDLGPYGCDVLDVFFPPRIDYNASRESRFAGYYKLVPISAAPKLLIDGALTKPGLTFTEGPSWMNGKLYFSNIHFTQDFTGIPAKSSLVEMSQDGTYRNIVENKMLTNGTIPSGRGTLIVCDMFGHRVIEVNTKGEVVKVLADSYEGKPLDGPNDLVMDAKGGIYFTDPQFTAETTKNQPGRCVYYIQPSGKLVRVIASNEFAMPNGILLSPDGKKLYVNNTYDDEVWWNANSNKDNYIWVYDVNEDGTLKNGKKFAELYLTTDVLDRKGKSSGADGMAIDVNGNLYVTTWAGVQLFDASGKFLGIINLPTYPTNCTFGGKDFKTLYIASHDKIYSIETNNKGFQLPDHK